LKSSNIFLDDSGDVEAIGDFYLKGINGKCLDEFDLVTISHYPPEFFSKGSELDAKGDIW